MAERELYRISFEKDLEQLHRVTQSLLMADRVATSTPIPVARPPATPPRWNVQPSQPVVNFVRAPLLPTPSARRPISMVAPTRRTPTRRELTFGSPDSHHNFLQSPYRHVSVKYNTLVQIRVLNLNIL